MAKVSKVSCKNHQDKKIYFRCDNHVCREYFCKDCLKFEVLNKKTGELKTYCCESCMKPSVNYVISYPYVYNPNPLDQMYPVVTYGSSTIQTTDYEIRCMDNSLTNYSDYKLPLYES